MCPAYAGHTQLRFRWARRANNETSVEPFDKLRASLPLRFHSLWEYQSKNLRIYKRHLTPLFFEVDFLTVFVVNLFQDQTLTKASIKRTGLSGVILSSKLVTCSWWREIPWMCCIIKNTKTSLFKQTILVIFDGVCEVFSQTAVSCDFRKPQ